MTKTKPIKNPKKILFVYNSNDGIYQNFLDTLWRMSTPITYPCNLGRLTHNPIFLKSEWKKFLSKLEMKPEFMHKNTFKSKYTQIKSELPSIFIVDGFDIKQIVKANEIKDCNNLDDLMDLLVEKLQK